MLDGKDIAAFDAQKVINAFGPLPRSGSYTSKGGTLIISASGSGFRSLAFARGGGLIGMDILVDGVDRGTTEVTTNERDSHRAFVPGFVVVEGLPAGPHTITLQAKNSSACNTVNEQVFTYCTTTNGDDTFYVTIVEIPD